MPSLEAVVAGTPARRTASATPTCDFDASVFKSRAAADFRMDRCVADTMRLMGGGDGTACAYHLTAIARESDRTRACTPDDVRAVCARSAATFTVDDASRLCALRQAADRRFWAERAILSAHVHDLGGRAP